jgi:hypothetical protein
MTDLDKWLNPKDLTKEMASAYAGGKSINQISIDFGYPTSTCQYMLKDYIPKKEDIIKFKMKFAAKRIKNKKYEV